MHTPHEPRLARAAAIVADPARSLMLVYLLSGEYLQAEDDTRHDATSQAHRAGWSLR